MTESMTVRANNKSYVFTIELREPGFWITIPGRVGGRDGAKDPAFSEQEAWMRRHSGLKEIWYLTWACPDLEGLDAFKSRLKWFKPGQVEEKSAPDSALPVYACSCGRRTSEPDRDPIGDAFLCPTCGFEVREV